MRESDNRDFYSKDSTTYESSRFSTALGRDNHNRLMACLEDLATGLDLESVVEVGVGTGRVTRVLLKAGAAAVMCVDISPDMLKVAEEKTADPRVTYVEGSAYDLPVETGTCTSFVSVNVLTHLDDLLTFWREAGRVLRPGGRAMVTSTKVDSVFFPFGVIANRRGSAFGHDVHSVWHRRKAQLAAISSAGGTVKSITGHFYTPRALDRGAAGQVIHRVIGSFEHLPPGLRSRLAPMDIYVVEF